MKQEELKIGMVVKGNAKYSADWTEIEEIRKVKDNTYRFRIGIHWYSAEEISIDWYCIFLLIGDGNTYQLKKPFHFIMNGKRVQATSITTDKDYRIVCEGGWEFPLYTLRNSTAKRLYMHVMQEKDKVDAEALCYGREDLMRVAESIANQLGDIDIAEDLCDKMAQSAFEFVKHIQNGGIYSVTPY